MDEFLVLIGSLVTVVLALVVGVTSYNLDVNKKKAEAIAKGNDPVAVMCAFENTSAIGVAAICNNTLKGNK